MVFLDCPGVFYGVLGCPMVSCGNQMHPLTVPLLALDTESKDMAMYS